MIDRDAIVAEAQSWLGTPYRHAHNIKGVGIDCAMLLVECYRAPRGTVPVDFDPRPYPQFWYLHRDEERYLANMLPFAERTTDPRPADVALYRFGRSASHGAIIVNEDLMIHAFAPLGRVAIMERRALDFRLDSYWTVK